jgi:large subunit ribosomal protein L11
VVITVYQDKSFTFITKSPPASTLLKRRPGSPRAPARRTGEGGQGDQEAGQEIAKLKEKDLNAKDMATRAASSRVRPAAWAVEVE